VEIPNNKSQMTNKYQHAAQAPALRVTEISNNKPVYDLEERAFQNTGKIKIVSVIRI